MNAFYATFDAYGRTTKTETECPAPELREYTFGQDRRGTDGGGLLEVITTGGSSGYTETLTHIGTR
ncbi:MAG: hypothetical protein MUO25_01950 [Thermoanaerobaculaceae bacterium]|nr:hypothetical protein [Thermoanaerobaculaceae bacterium]